MYLKVRNEARQVVTKGNEWINFGAPSSMTLYTGKCVSEGR